MRPLSDWFIYLVLGRVMIYLWQQFPLPQFLTKKKSIEYLHSCDLCSGVYCYSILAFFMRMDLLSVLGFYYVPFVSEFLTGACISFLAHIFILGWKAKFDVVILE